MEQDILNAVTDFKKETFDGVKDGLGEMGKAVHFVPDLLKNCQKVQADLTRLYQVADVFKHPMTLMYTIGKNLVVNGVDIFTKMASAMDYFNKQDYYNFGKQVGEALAELVLKTATLTKNEDDDNAF